MANSNPVSNADPNADSTDPNNNNELENIAVSSSLPVLLFFIVTLLYLIVKSTMRNTDPMAIAGGYFVAVILTQGFLNAELVKKNCNGNANIGLAMRVTILPWIFIFGLLFVALILFPSWKRPFANTFGFLIIKILGVDRLLKGEPPNVDGILKKNTNIQGINNRLIDINVLVSTNAVNNLYNDPSLLVNELNSDNFDEVIYNMKPLFRTGTEKDIGKLKDMINIKEAVSEFIWYIAGGLVTISGTQNILNNSKCSSK